MEKLKFRNWLDVRYDHKRKFCKAGDRVHTEYQPVYDNRGQWHLEPCGETNLYLDIQSHAESCDINVIMARYANGETDVLSRIQGVYGDFTNVPTNYAEIMNQQIKAKALFMSLAPEVREKYDNSVEVFMSSLGTKEGWEALGFRFGEEKESGAGESTGASAGAGAPAEAVKEGEKS